MPQEFQATHAAQQTGQIPQARRPDVIRDDTTGARRRVASSDLFGAFRELEIDHAGAVYRLRVTALGKLILTK